MAQLSAGLLMYRFTNGSPEFFLVHPGGPFYARKDEGAWSIPKGLCNPGEVLLEAAKREFIEETGLATTGPFTSLGFIRMNSGKIVHAWMFAGEWNADSGIISNTFSIEWPPKSGRIRQVPEADRAGWFTLQPALTKINSQQQPFLLRAHAVLQSH